MLSGQKLRKVVAEFIPKAASKTNYRSASPARFHEQTSGRKAEQRKRTGFRNRREQNKAVVSNVVWRITAILRRVNLKVKGCDGRRIQWGVAELVSQRSSQNISARTDVWAIVEKT